MNFDTVITLIKQTANGSDSSGNAVYTEERRQIYAGKKSVRQTEFFQAAALGFKPEIALEIYAFEYGGEEYCELDGERFRIYRTFCKAGGDRLELYLTSIAGDTNVLT